MCGINGAIAPHASPDWRFDKAWRMLVHTESRGRHATGIGWHTPDGMPMVTKAPMPASQFVNHDAFEPFFEHMPTTWIGHCRATTKGTEKNNVNNHPVYSKQTGLILVHNGTINDEPWRAKNDNGVNPYMLNDFDGEVDTEAILRLIETCWYIPREPDMSINPATVETTPKEQWTRQVSLAKAIDDATYNIVGGFACAVLNPEEPNTVYLFRHNNPIYVAYVPEVNAILWASTEEILRKSLTVESEELIFGYFPKKKSQVIEYHGVSMPDDTMLRIEAVGKTFKVDSYKIAPPAYTKVGREIRVVGGENRATTAQSTTPSTQQSSATYPACGA